MILRFMLLLGLLAAGAHGMTLRDFGGTCQGSVDRPLLWDTALGWDRHDIGWSDCEPQRGEWHADALEHFGQRVLAARAKGVRILPVLCYNAPWSWDRGERSFAYEGTRWHIVPRADGKFDVTTTDRDGQTRTEVQSGGGMWPLAAERQADWAAYVRRVVTFLRSEPYGVEYFQIWNEAHPRSGFWFGDLDSYMQRVHLPAAKVIRELGGKVVYGGWPCCGSVPEYLALLDKHQAWDTLDVLDVHYSGLQAFEQLHAAARPHGGRSIWQTEVGFAPNIDSVPNTWTRVFYWALTHGGQQSPDFCRQFHFAYWSPNDPKAYGYRHCLLSGDQLSVHGQSLATLAALLGSGAVRPYADVATQPALLANLDGASDGAEGFALADRVVVALHVRRAGLPEHVVLRLPKLASARQVARVSATGERQPLVALADADGLTIAVPTAGLSGDSMVTCYVSVEGVSAR
ncbi:MAG: hypothetical protein HZB16_22095 [Armatimonadetes bacterium]|nr:hypothetical protein [Armatimonadota bacterium]